MKRQIKVSIFFTLISTVSLGIIYPVLLAGIGLIIPSISRPSLLTHPAQKVQFQGRPSMSGGPYSGASNLSLTSLELAKQVEERLKRLTEDLPKDIKIPQSLLFASASGYDPNITIQGALFQIPSIAKTHNIDKGILEKLLFQHTEHKLWGFIGSEMVNVIEVNKDLEKFLSVTKP